MVYLEVLYFDCIFTLTRNVLQVPTNVRREGRTMDDVSLHDQVLWVLYFGVLWVLDVLVF